MQHIIDQIHIPTYEIHVWNAWLISYDICWYYFNFYTYFQKWDVNLVNEKNRTDRSEIALFVLCI